MTTTKVLTDDEFVHALNASDAVTVVDMFSHFAGPCEPVTSVLKKLKQEFGDQLTFLQAQTDSISYFQAWRNRSCPTFSIWICGVLIGMVKGANTPLLEQIIREQIQLNAITKERKPAFSPLALECLFHARTMGLATCFTDHSLFGFHNTQAILINKVLKFVLANIDHVICVSHTARENTVLRAALNPFIVSVIPNALLSSQFQPDPSKRNPNFVTIVTVSRLVYNKGADLLARVIPYVCKKFPNVRFLIAGDGNKRIDLEQMRERYILQDRVTLLGSIRHDQVRDVLVQGHLFLNTSLTEAFCIGIIEAACAGLHVVSTKVGGVPELLPSDMITFAQTPSTQALLEAITLALQKWASVNPYLNHERVSQMYSWQNVALRTEIVYTSIMNSARPTLPQCLVRLRQRGPVAGLLFCLVYILDVFLNCFLDWWSPKDAIEIAPTFTQQHWKLLHGSLIHPEKVDLLADHPPITDAQ
ncbi:hypothetical protein HMI55_005862 [Coelomomyces lativittatus]|nr:hypothetical protein HMI55_005862 [Coelomomyces lativittatus]